MIVLMKLGNWQFSVPGLDYNRLSRRFEYRWQPQDRIGARPAQQWLGPGEETLDFRGFIYPQSPYSSASARTELDAMRTGAVSGTPYAFAGAVGNGAKYLGLWCIKQIRDEQEYFLPNGDPRKIDFGITLVNYGI